MPKRTGQKTNPRTVPQRFRGAQAAGVACALGKPRLTHRHWFGKPRQLGLVHAGCPAGNHCNFAKICQQRHAGKIWPVLGCIDIYVCEKMLNSFTTLYLQNVPAKFCINWQMRLNVFYRCLQMFVEIAQTHGPLKGPRIGCVSLFFISFM